MKISRVAVITSVALFALTACGRSESSIQSSSPSANSSPQATLPPKGSRPSGENRPCWANGGGCTFKAVGPGGGIVFANTGVPAPWGQFIEVSKQTLGSDKLCDSETPRTAFWMWPDYDGIGNNFRATSDLYNVCKNGLAGKVYGHSQTSPVYDKWWLDDQSFSGASGMTWIPVVENCCKDWRLPTLEEAKMIYALNSGQNSLGPCWRFNEKCEDFKVEDGWYYTATPNLEPGKCEYWAINMADGQTKSVKPNEQLRGLMVRNFGRKKEGLQLQPPRVPIPERSELESKTLDFLQKLFKLQFKYRNAGDFEATKTPTTKEEFIEALLKHPNAVKKVSCPVPAPTTTTTVAPTTTTTTTTVAPTTTTTTTTVAPTTTVKKVVTPTTVKKIVKKK